MAIEVLVLSNFLKGRLVHWFGKFPFKFRLPSSGDSDLKIFGSLEARAGYLKGKNAVDKILIDFVETFVDRRDLVVWDVGANIGVFGFMASAAGATSVLLFEPDLHSCSLMLRTKQLNRVYDACQIMPFAIADDLGMARFEFSTQGGAANRLTEYSGARANAGVESFACDVPVFSVEFMVQDLKIEKPNIVKIDVEGAEADILLSMRPLLRQNNIVLLIECGQSTKANCTSILRELGYIFFNSCEDYTKGISSCSITKKDTIAVKLGC